MRVREVYDCLGENYEAVCARLVTDERVAKYIKRILEDPTMGLLEKALAEKDYAEGFRTSHSLKGMAYNLGLDSLGNAASELCETMRNGAPQVDVAPLLDKVRAEYERAYGCVSAFAATD